MRSEAVKWATILGFQAALIAALHPQSDAFAQDYWRARGSGLAAAPAYSNTHMLDLGGTNEYGVDTDDMPVGGNAYGGWSLWVNQANCVGDEDVLARWDTTNGEWIVRTYAGTSTCRVYFFVSAAGLVASFKAMTTPDNSMTEGAWNHIGIRYDGTAGTDATKITIAINGVAQTLSPAGAGALPATLPDATMGTTLGARNSGSPTSYYLGFVDEIAVWYGAASGDVPSLATMYNSGALTDHVNMTPKPEHCWNMNGDTNPAVVDKCGSSTYNFALQNTEAGDISSSSLPP